MSDEINDITETTDIGEVSDGYHTFNELYRYRMLYNAMAVKFLSMYSEEGDGSEIFAVKSKTHSDGQPCFGGGWFVVYMYLPTGEVSNHYPMAYWDLFDCLEVDPGPVWDGHTPQQAADRMQEFLSVAYWWRCPGCGENWTAYGQLCGDCMS